MKRRGYQKYMERKKALTGQRVVGIDPASRKHQAAVLDEDGIQIGKSFSFPVSYEGYTEKLWKQLTKILGDYSPGNLVFAVECSCALWKPLADYLTDAGYTVVLVSPLVTYHSRALVNHDFSKTDPKDALIVGTNARNGSYNEYRRSAPDVMRLHRLSITYEKLAKDRQKAVGRLRALMQEVFPEYLSGVGVDTLTSLHLLDKYLLPGDFMRMSIKEEERQVRRISNGTHGTHTLATLKALAEKSIGAHVEEAAEVRLTLDAWSMQLRQIDQSLKKVASAMIELAKKTEYFAILTSLKGVSDITAARFIAECRDLSNYGHYKQIEKLAGANLRTKDSGTFEGTRRISKLGNKRLLRLIYLMTTQVVKLIPEVRIKFIRRQLAKKCYRKNIVACIPWLLKLIMALVREKRPYVFRELPEDYTKLEAKYMDIRNGDRKMREAA